MGLNTEAGCEALRLASRYVSVEVDLLRLIGVVSLPTGLDDLVLRRVLRAELVEVLLCVVQELFTK